MIAALLVVFREVLEASLIIGIVAAATAGIAGRNRAIAIGVTAGGLGAILVAGFAGSIAEALEGSGQEVFNACVLFLAVAMLGWHNVWMSHHGRQMAADMKALGRSVSEGQRSLVAVTLAVGLAILREGSEVVLFLYGIASSGESATALVVGGLIGLALGAVAGWALYKGLLRLSTRHLFSITSWMILLLAAGLAAQGARFLMQAELLPAFGNTVWDTSWLLSEQSWAGLVLHTLIGYTARPAGIQVLFYLVTLILIGGSMYFVKQRKPRNAVAACVAMLASALGLLLVSHSRAEAAAIEVYSPHVEQGEAEIEYTSRRSVDSNAAKNDEQIQKISLGYGVNEYWFTEIYAGWIRDPGPGESRHFDAFEWENRFQLTEPGAEWADLGLLVEYERVKDQKNDADEFAIGPLVEKDLGKATNTFNLVFEKQLGSNAADGVNVTYRWQTRWRIMPEFEPAIQALGELGPIDHILPYRDQEHHIGPAILGKFQIGGLPGRFGYDIGYLFGASNASSQGAFKLSLEYEFPL